MSEEKYPSFAVLLVDDEAAWLRSLSMSLASGGGITNIIQCPDSRKVMDILAGHEVGLVLLDLTMPHLSGEELLAMISERFPEVLVIVVSAMNQLETAVHCMKQGAFDYFVKTVEEDRLITGVRHAIRIIELQREREEMGNRLFAESLEHPDAFAELPTVSRKMHSVFQYIEAIAKSKHPVLVTGESGVGKELVAKAIHGVSRRDKPMVAVNVAGLDDTMLSDSLFGHVRGAFTGADDARSGLIEQAGDGTLFLDEIGDLNPASQVKLLRLLQEGEYFPVGSDRQKQLRARVVVATNQDLKKKLDQGQFRRDLYYRLHTHHIQVPPLRERKEDIPHLLDLFLDEAARELEKKKPAIPKELPVLLSTYSFPGNVRELRSMVFDAVSTHRAKTLSMDSFKRAIGLHDEAGEAGETEAYDDIFQCVRKLPPLQQVEDLLVAEALRRAEGNQSIAAKLLGISQPALSKRLRPARERGGGEGV